MVFRLISFKRLKFNGGHRIFCLSFLGLNLLALGDVFFRPGAVLSSPLGDLAQHFIDWRGFAADQIGQGIIPLWAPAYLGGVPFLGGFESALFYPFNFLFLFFPLALAANLEIFGQVLAVGLLGYGWAASRGLKPAACLLAACVISWSGPFFLQVYAGHLTNLCAMVWIPLIFWALEELFKKISLGWAALLALAVCLQGFAGHPQYFYYTALMAAGYGFLKGLSDLRRLQKWAAAGAAYGIGFFLSAAQWLPGLQAVGESMRGHLADFKTAGLFSLPPENFITFLMPGFFGPVGSAQYWGRWYLWDVCLFVGPAALFFCFWSLAVKRSQRLPEMGMMALAGLLALGQSTPLFRLLFDFLPGIKSFRGTCKFDFFMVVFIAVLAAEGFDQMLQKKKLPSSISKFWAGAAVLSMMLSLCLWLSARGGLDGNWGRWMTSLSWLKETFSALDRDSLNSFVQGAGIRCAESLLILAFTALLLALGAFWARRSPRGIYGMAALAVLELFIFARVNRPLFDEGIHRQNVDQVRHFYQTHPGDYRVLGTGSGAALEGGRDLWDGEPLILSRFGHFVAQSQGFAPDAIFRTSPVFKKMEPIYALERLKYIFDFEDPAHAKAIPMRFAPMAKVNIFHQAQIAASPQASLDDLLRPGFDFRHQLILEKAPLFPLAKPRAVESLFYRDLSVNQMQIEADLAAPGILLITDNYGLGWKAREAGGALEVEPVDGFLRGIVLPEGPHRFSLCYAPDSFRVGLWISLVSMMFYVVILACVFRRSLFPTPQRKWSREDH
jgi:hypothetical protein